MSELLFSITKKDLIITYFKGSGAGGQKRNKTSNAARVQHQLSGAIGECQETRSKETNLKRAFNKMVESEKFQTWLKLETAARLQGHRDMEEKVNKMMSEENLKIEYFDPEK